MYQNKKKLEKSEQLEWRIMKLFQLKVSLFPQSEKKKPTKSEIRLQRRNHTQPIVVDGAEYE